MINQIKTFGPGAQTFFDQNENSTITLRDGDESYELTPQILKRIIEIVKKEFPEDQLWL